MPALSYQILGDAGSLRGAIRSAMEAVQGMKAAMSAALGGIDLAAPVDAFKKALKEAGDMEQTRTSFAVLLKSMSEARRLMLDLTRFAAETPFEMPELAGAARSLLAFGFTQREVIDELRRLGDVASGVQMPIGELAEIYGKARVGGRLMAEDINQLTGRGIPVIQEFAKQFGVAESEVRGLVESGQVGFTNLQQALRSLTGDGGLFAGMMRQMSGTWNGLLSTMSDAWNALFRSFGEPLIEELKPALQEAIAAVERMSGLAREVGTALADAIRMGLAVLEREDRWRLAGLLLKVGMIEAAQGFFAAVQRGWQEMRGPLEKIMSGLGTMIEGWGHMLSAAIMLGVTEAMAKVKILGRSLVSADAQNEAQMDAAASNYRGKQLQKAGLEQMLAPLGEVMRGLATPVAEARAEIANIYQETQRQAAIDRDRRLQAEEDERLLAMENAYQGEEGKAGGGTAGGGGFLEPLTKSDRWAQIGAFVGAAPAAQRAAQDTARNTARAAVAAEKTNDLLAEAARNRPTSGSAIF